MKRLLLGLVLSASLLGDTVNYSGMSYDTATNILSTTTTGNQVTLVSGTNIKTINGSSVLGSGDLTVSGSAAWGSVTGTLANQTDLQTALNAKLATNGSAANLTGFPTLNQNTTGSAANLTTARTINGTAFDGTGNITLSAGSVTDAMLAGTTAATSATTGTMTVNMTTDIITITPTGACTFNASGGRTGRIITFSVTTSGASSFTLTFGTNFRKTGTLATGTTSARFFAVTFRCLDGTIWQEIARTAVQT